MKTDKQIKLLQMEKGKELAEQIKELDNIKVRKSDSDKWFANLPNDTDYITTPVVKTGVLVVSYFNFSGYIIFDAEFKENCYEIKADIFNDINSTYNWDCSIKANVPYNVKQQMNYTVFHFENATTKIYQKQKRKESEINKYIEKMVNDACMPFGMYVKTMCYINWLMQHPEYKKIENKESKITNNSNKKRNSKIAINDNRNNSKNVHKVKINNIRFVTKENKIVSGLKSQKKRFLLGSWGVRGHFRHYRNGKIVYIKPYTKGKGNQSHKEYIV